MMRNWKEEICIALEAYFQKFISRSIAMIWPSSELVNRYNGFFYYAAYICAYLK
jgi:hypothetical protein